MSQFCLPFLLLLFVTTAHADTLYKFPEKPDTGLLTEGQITSQSYNPLLFDQFTAIYRYPSLYQNNSGELDKISQQTIEQIKAQLKEINNQESIITIVGHSQKNYKSSNDIRLSTFLPRGWQRLGETIPPEQEETQGDVNENMRRVKQILLDDGIAEAQIYLENRNGHDNGFAETERNGRKLNQRVDVAIYLIKERDSDGDGVLDRADLCPNTGKGIIVYDNGCAQTFTLHLEFIFDTNKLRNPKDKNTVKQVDILKLFSTILQNHQEYRAVVIGYTDSTGEESYNQHLSLQRAQAVRDLLIQEGISEYRIGIDGLGEKYPIASNDTKEGRQQNRRIELKLLVE